MRNTLCGFDPRNGTTPRRHIKLRMVLGIELGRRIACALEKEHFAQLSQLMLLAQIRILCSGFHSCIQHPSRMFRDVGINFVLALLEQLVQSRQERLDPETIFYRRHPIKKLVLKLSEGFDSL
jgi:hypothetical protein